MSKQKDTVLDTAYKTEVLEFIKTMLIEKRDEEVYKVENGAIAFPFVNANGKEGWVKVVVSTPKGERGSDGYDGHHIAKCYAQDLVIKAEKDEALRIKREKKIRADEEQRAETKRLREAKKQKEE